MTLGAAEVVPGRAGWRILCRPGPDLAPLLIGKPVAEVAALMPRLFNLCRVAQGQAACLSLGLPLTADTADGRAEIIRDHLAHLFVFLPRALGIAPVTPPAPQDRAAIFGANGTLPADGAALRRWLAGDGALARLAARIAALFPADLCAIPALPAPQGLAAGLRDNAPATRQSGHPALAELPRGPLWRLIGRLYDLQAALADTLPAPRLLADGTAVVQAARGAYALRLIQADGHVTGIDRLTPTDHQLAPRGALELGLRQLPADRADLAAVLIALHDPCIPVTLGKAVQHA